MVGTRERLPGLTRRKEGMTSNHNAPYVQGFTHATMVGTTRLRAREGELIAVKPVVVRIGVCNSTP